MTQVAASTTGFRPRISSSFEKAGVPVKVLDKFKKFPNLVMAFHIASPKALEKLSKDRPLMEMLEAHFSKDRRISKELSMTLQQKGLIAFPVTEENHNCYLFFDLNSSGDKEIMAELVHDFDNNPDIADLRVCLCRLGVKLDIKVALTSEKEGILAKAFFTAVLKFIDRSGIKTVRIVPGSEFSRVATEPSGRVLTIYEGSIDNVLSVGLAGLLGDFL